MATIPQQNIVLAVAIAYHNRPHAVEKFDVWSTNKHDEIAMYLLGVDKSQNMRLFANKHGQFGASLNEIKAADLQVAVDKTFGNNEFQIDEAKLADDLAELRGMYVNGVANVPPKSKTTHGGASSLSVDAFINMLGNNSPVMPPFSSPLFNFYIQVISELHRRRSSGSASSTAATNATYNKAFNIKMSGHTVVVTDMSGVVQGEFENNSCKNAGLGSSGSRCGSILSSCSGNRDQCISVLMTLVEEELLSVEELHKVNPIYIRDFLNKVGYGVDITQHGNNTNVRFATFARFLDEIKNTDAHTKLTNGSPEADRVRRLLERLATYVNSKYPEVLNAADLYASTNSAGTGTTRKEVNLRYPMNLQGQRPGDMTSLMLPGIMNRSRSLVNSAFLPFGSFGFPMAALGMRGGGLEFNVNLVESAANSAKYYKEGIENLITALKGQGKALDSVSDAGIQARVSKFETAARDFAEHYQTIRDYVNTNARVRDQRMELNFDSMKDHTARYKQSSDRYMKTEAGIIDVLAKLQNLLNDAMVGKRLPSSYVA